MIPFNSLIEENLDWKSHFSPCKEEKEKSDLYYPIIFLNSIVGGVRICTPNVSFRKYQKVSIN
jgi:hypothetical protein